MSNFFGALEHSVAYASTGQILWCIGVILCVIALTILHHFWKNNDKLLRFWRLLCAVPTLMCVVHFCIYCLCPRIPGYTEAFIPLYIPAILCLAGTLIAKPKMLYRIFCSVLIVVTVLCSFYFIPQAPNVKNYSRLGYVDSFHAAVSEIKRNYVLGDWKDIDFDALEAKYLPEIEEAERNGDEAAFVTAIRGFTIEFYDGHVWYNIMKPEARPKVTLRDYGLATIRFDSGEVVAVNTSVSANALGIHDGTIILEWDNRPVDDAIRDMTMSFSVPVAATEEIIKSIYFSGYGDETVNVTYLDDEGNRQSVVLTAQFEYGLAISHLSTGEFAAMGTTEAAQAVGIHDNTVILEWNNQPISEVMSEFEPHGASSEASHKPVYFSGAKGNTVSITFLDDNGNKQSAELSATQTPHLPTAASTYQQFTSAATSYDDAINDINFSTKMLDDKCGYLRLKAEATDSLASDLYSYLVGTHKPAQRMFREKLDSLSAQGMEYLIIDIRNNGGGLDTISCALTSLFTDTEMFGEGLGIERNGEYVSIAKHSIPADGSYKDMKVVVITNCECASAGDGAALYLSKLPNVTLVGLTDSVGCNQETGGEIILADGIVSISYPTGLVLNENNEPNIDIRADRISRNPLEVRIPIDKTAITRLFVDHVDYELEWAMQYLKQG